MDEKDRKRYIFSLGLYNAFHHILSYQYILIHLVTVESNFERAVYLLIFHLLLFMFLWSYYETIFRPVGRPPKMVNYFTVQWNRAKFRNLVSLT